MAFEPTSSNLIATAQDTLSAAWEKLQGSFSNKQFSPEAALVNTPGIDPHFIPRAPMGSANIDVATLNMLGRKGFKRGREITTETHPELYRAWALMSMRAGLPRIPQLILAESDMVNAVTLSPEEVAVSTGLLKMLNLREVTAVLGHELGHEASNHTKPRAIAMGAFGGLGMVIGDRIAHRGGIGSYIDHTTPNPGFFKRASQWLFTHREGRAASLLSSVMYIALGGSVGWMVANQVAVRPTELDADRKGAMISGDPEGLISALTKLEAGRGERTFMQRLHHVRSGYPSHASRVSHLRSLTASIPADTAVIATLEAPVQAAAVTINAPATQISSANLEQRVATPEQAQAVGL